MCYQPESYSMSCSVRERKPDSLCGDSSVMGKQCPFEQVQSWRILVLCPKHSLQSNQCCCTEDSLTCLSLWLSMALWASGYRTRPPSELIIMPHWWPWLKWPKVWGTQLPLIWDQLRIHRMWISTRIKRGRNWIRGFKKEGMGIADKYNIKGTI